MLQDSTRNTGELQKMYSYHGTETTESPSSGDKQPARTVRRAGRSMRALLEVLGQKGASFNSLARNSEPRCLFLFPREDSCEIRGQEAMGYRIFFQLGDS